MTKDSKSDKDKKHGPEVLTELADLIAEYLTGRLRPAEKPKEDSREN